MWDWYDQLCSLYLRKNLSVSFDDKQILSQEAPVYQFLNFLLSDAKEEEKSFVVSQNLVGLPPSFLTSRKVEGCSINAKIYNISRANGDLAGCISAHLECYGAVLEPELDLGCQR